MAAESLEMWNRGLVTAVLEIVEESEAKLHDAAGRLRDFLAVNPGGPALSVMAGLNLSPEEERRYMHDFRIAELTAELETLNAASLVADQKTLAAAS